MRIRRMLVWMVLGCMVLLTAGAHADYWSSDPDIYSDGLSGYSPMVLCDLLQFGIEALDEDTYHYDYDCSSETIEDWMDEYSATWQTTPSLEGQSEGAFTYGDHNVLVYYLMGYSPCTGTVTASVSGIDDYGGFPPYLTRADDEALPEQETSTQVVLPPGCTMGTKSADLGASKGGETSGGCSPTSCGVTRFIFSNITTDIDAVYDNCNWVFQVSSSLDVPCGPCSGNYIEVSFPIDMSVVTADNYCGIIDSYVNGNGCGSGYSTSTCVQQHEDKHFSQFYDSLTTTAKAWLLTRASMTMAIDCSNFYTHHCIYATYARQAAIESDVRAAYLMACNSDSEQACVDAASPCFREFASSIWFEGYSRGWPLCGPRP